ncbi:hypothetical protein HMPREF1991_03013 [Hoylesella loescheii DSM 19665 = JCM 12249 = ATCC 15930]|uniref:Uncharacterized protein n=1 Tax=Hoylesella loescheii DSM 19665 = JCM 12249 = ATCC 15930 TaxID=1122985 RepID=A0A069QM51_HOYLO|nr:hypothetical protein HMPREF1991_03013 [Hoylesella loescheii DSM 19665 = JCM 12249 = ATCC 15930]
MAMKNGKHHLPCLYRVERKRRRKSTRVWDKTQLLCQLPLSASWRDSHFFNCPVLFKRHGFLSPTRQLTIPSFVFSLFRKCAC